MTSLEELLAVLNVPDSEHGTHDGAIAYVELLIAQRDFGTAMLDAAEEMGNAKEEEAALASDEIAAAKARGITIPTSSKLIAERGIMLSRYAASRAAYAADGLDPDDAGVVMTGSTPDDLGDLLLGAAMVLKDVEDAEAAREKRSRRPRRPYTAADFVGKDA